MIFRSILHLSERGIQEKYQLPQIRWPMWSLALVANFNRFSLEQKSQSHQGENLMILTKKPPTVTSTALPLTYRFQMCGFPSLKGVSLCLIPVLNLSLSMMWPCWCFPKVAIWWFDCWIFHTKHQSNEFTVQIKMHLFQNHDFKMFVWAVWVISALFLSKKWLIVRVCLLP